MENYEIVHRLEFIRDCECGFNNKEALNIAIDAVKKQDQMKVNIKDTYVDGTGTFLCPNCHRKMGDYYTRLSESYKHCKYCGQALDWRND